VPTHRRSPWCEKTEDTSTFGVARATRLPSNTAKPHQRRSDVTRWLKAENRSALRMSSHSPVLAAQFTQPVLVASPRRAAATA
jgi:hypothetical protein